MFIVPQEFSIGCEMESVIVEHHGHSGMQILNKSICNINVADRIAT
jgi:hypothetical protein